MNKLLSYTAILTLSFWVVSAEAKIRKIVDIPRSIVRLLAKGSDNFSGKVSPGLQRTIRRDVSKSNSISKSTFHLLQANRKSLSSRHLSDPAFVRFIEENPNLAEQAVDIAARFPIRNIGQRLDDLAVQSAGSARQILEVLPRLPESEAMAFLRGIDGRELSNHQIAPLVKSLSESTNPNVAADAFELLARRQFETGAMRVRAGLKPGSTVIDGRFDRIHGIDGIGVGNDGRPIIFEFTIDRAKRLSRTGELSPQWTAERWNRLVAAQPDKIQELVRDGMDPAYVRPLASEEAGSLSRKLVGHTDQVLTDTNRLYAGLSMDDLIVLGRPN